MARAAIEERTGLLSAAIAILALADGAIHLSLDFILFHGRLFADPFAIAFVLNFLSYVVLTVAFLFIPRSALGWRRAIDLAMIAVAATAFVVWFLVGRPNPNGLGYLSKAIEVVLIVALITHLRSLAQDV